VDRVVLLNETQAPEGRAALLARVSAHDTCRDLGIDETHLGGVDRGCALASAAVLADGAQAMARQFALRAEHPSAHLAGERLAVVVRSPQMAPQVDQARVFPLADLAHHVLLIVHGVDDLGEVGVGDWLVRLGRAVCLFVALRQMDVPRLAGGEGARALGALPDGWDGDRGSHRGPGCAHARSGGCTRDGAVVGWPRPVLLFFLHSYQLHVVVHRHGFRRIQRRSSDRERL